MHCEHWSCGVLELVYQPREQFCGAALPRGQKVPSSHAVQPETSTASRVAPYLCGTVLVVWERGGAGGVLAWCSS